MTDTGITLKDYYEQLRSHDWYYQYSDDGWVYNRGTESETRVRNLAKQSPEHQKMYDEFRAHKFSGGPAPERPT